MKPKYFEQKIKFFISYEDKDYEIPYSYYKKVEKILKQVPIYNCDKQWEFYKLSVSYNLFLDFVKFGKYNKQCVKNNVDFNFQTLYMIETHLKMSEINIDTFNYYCKKYKSSYYLNIIPDKYEKIKVVYKQ